MAVRSARQKVAPARPLDIPAERPVATGELVSVRDVPEYRRKHGLRIVKAFWLSTERQPRLIVEDMDPQRGKEQS